MDASEVFSFAHALATVNRHPNPEQFARDVSDAYTPPVFEAPALANPAEEPTVVSLNPV